MVAMWLFFSMYPILISTKCFLNAYYLNLGNNVQWVKIIIFLHTRKYYHIQGNIFIPRIVTSACIINCEIFLIIKYPTEMSLRVELYDFINRKSTMPSTLIQKERGDSFGEGGGGGVRTDRYQLLYCVRP